MAVSVSQNGSQIAALYQQYLGRSAAPSEIADWVNHTKKLASNTGCLTGGSLRRYYSSRFA